MFPTMLRRDRERNGLRIARASWLIGVTLREYYEIVWKGFPFSHGVMHRGLVC